MMKKCRQLHLWIGLFTSLLILIEAVTGLFMTEPWLIGENRPSTEQRVQLEKTKTGEPFGREAGEYGKPVQNNLMRFIKGLHSGRIGNTDLSVFLDIAAIALIILSTTGIILSIKTLKAQSIAKKKNSREKN